MQSIRKSFGKTAKDFDSGWKLNWGLVCTFAHAMRSRPFVVIQQMNGGSSSLRCAMMVPASAFPTERLRHTNPCERRHTAARESRSGVP